MPSLAQRITRQPLWIIGVLWPLVMLAPLVPGLPRPTPTGPLWRQEIALALLLSVTLALMSRQARAAVEHFLSKADRRSDSFMLLPLALFILWSAISMTWAANPVAALQHTLMWGAYGLFYILMRRASAHPRLLHTLLKVLALIILILSLATMIEFWGSPMKTDVGIISLFRHYVGFGEPLAVAIPIYAALALGLRKRRVAVLCGATAITAWLATLQMYERTVTIAAGAGLLTLFVMSVTMRRLRPRSWWRASMLLVGLMAATTLQIAPSALTNNNPTVLSRLSSPSVDDQNSIGMRLLYWGIGLEMLRAHPLTGVGANNYDVAVPEARAQFAARYADSSLLNLSEDKLASRAHNEYVQIMAELGMVGFALFLLFCGALVWVAARALRDARSPLSLGATCSMLVFAISSGASSASFRWLGSGLIFFFAAALLSRRPASAPHEAPETAVQRPPYSRRTATAGVLIFALLMLCVMFAQATNSVLHAKAQASRDAREAEQLYRAALKWNPFDGGTNFNYGVWLFYERRAREAVPYLRYSVTHGFNVSACYAYLAAAQAGAGDAEGAEQTLAQAVSIYPRSVFLRVRHALALRQTERIEEADQEFMAAVSMDARRAHGWRQLISNGVDAASRAAQRDSSIALPGELYPENCLFAALAEYERRAPAVLQDGQPLRAINAQ